MKPIRQSVCILSMTTVAAIATACSSDPSTDDLLNDPALFERVSQECAMKDLRGEDTDTPACKAAAEARSLLMKRAFERGMESMGQHP